MEKKKNVRDLIIFIVICIIAFGLIITGFLLDQSGRRNFVKTEDVPKYITSWYVYFLEIFGAVMLLSSFGFLRSFLQANYNIKKMNVREMTVIGIFGGLTIVLYYFAKFNLPFFPPWLDIQFSDVPALLVTFMYGPVSGSLVILLRFICKLPGTSTVGVGELADLLIGVSLCLTAGFIYKRNRKFKGALLGMGIGMLVATFVAVIANWLILIPAYKGIAGFSQEMLNSILQSIIAPNMDFGYINDKNFMFNYIILAVIPFNIFRYILVFIITLIVYKRLHKIIIRFAGNYNEREEIKEEQDD
ncbi:MAG: ECF transporter S component [Bacilli bacterium]|nr:ECF transporter S component [Bacilli bacterium]